MNLLEAIKATSGCHVSVASSLTATPPNGRWLQPVEVVGSAPDNGQQSMRRWSSADYFSVLRIPVLEGRTLTREEINRGAHCRMRQQDLRRSLLRRRRSHRKNDSPTAPL